jgi:hypothetical protein
MEISFVAAEKFKALPVGDENPPKLNGFKGRSVNPEDQMKILSYCPSSKCLLLSFFCLTLSRKGKL